MGSLTMLDLLGSDAIDLAASVGMDDDSLELDFDGTAAAPIDASRGDDERVFDSLHRAGIDIKLVGNSTNGFSSL
jgi:hypothetical protein